MKGKPLIAALALLMILALVLISIWRIANRTNDKEKETTMEVQTQRFQFQMIDQTLLAELSQKEKEIILNKGTERAFTGEYTDLAQEGTYYCKQCGSPLYTSQDKFHSSCGWPSFDDELPFAIERHTDADGSRIEIICATCKGHLGHVFLGEGLTDKDTRHCVNSLSLRFEKGSPVAKAVFAGGCFWGVEHLFEQVDGVHAAMSGYTGGHLENPTYQDVLTHKTGHLEAVEVLYDPRVVSYEELAKYFFEIHDPTQTNGQGPDIGNQYLSSVFYRSRHEFDTVVKLISILEEKGLKIATSLRPAAIFYPAEEYHQDYYALKGTQPYCHAWTKRF